MNKDVEMRDKILFGKYDPDSYRFGGCKNFHCSYETMKTLIENGFVDLNECQNDSPTTADFMDILDGINNVEFIAYAIGPDRSDYRITIEGVDVEIPDDNYDLFIQLIEHFRYADEFDVSHPDGSFCLHAWWD